MKPEQLENLGKLLQPEDYPYQRGLARRFALASLGQPEELKEAFRSASYGQGVNSRANFLSGIEQLEQQVPGILTDGILFPERLDGEITVSRIPVSEAKKRARNFLG